MLVHLIEARIEMLVEHGYSDTALTGAAQRTTLALGLDNFHFESNAKLLADTLI